MVVQLERFVCVSTCFVFLLVYVHVDHGHSQIWLFWKLGTFGEEAYIYIKRAIQK
jgi:hypothetical protein